MKDPYCPLHLGPADVRRRNASDGSILPRSAIAPGRLTERLVQCATLIFASDEGLRNHFYSRLQMLHCGGTALSQHLQSRLEALAFARRTR